MSLSTFLTPSSLRAHFARVAQAVFALGCVTLLAGCDLNFWTMNGPQSTINVAGPVARSQLQLFYVTCWVTFVIFILVASVLAYATLKFRAKNETNENAEPPVQGHGNPLIELSLIGASVLALVIIAVPTLKAIWFTHDVPVADRADAYTVNAIGSQWWFRFEYPNEQIKDVGQLVTSNELVIPAGRAVQINLRGMDVIHSFWIPRLAGKVDMIPNRANYLWLKADEPGYFWGQCAEFCGDSHAVMRFRVIALGPKEFNEWLEQQSAPARTVAAAGTATPKFAAYRTDFKRNAPGYTDAYDLKPLEAWRAKQFPEKQEDAALIAKGRGLFQSKTCFSCHAVRGHMVGGSAAYPDLTHVGARTTIAAGLLENNPEQMARWIRHPDEVKPGNHMWRDGYLKNNIKLNEEEISALVAYLQSLK